MYKICLGEKKKKGLGWGGGKAFVLALQRSDEIVSPRRLSPARCDRKTPPTVTSADQFLIIRVDCDDTLHRSLFAMRACQCFFFVHPQPPPSTNLAWRSSGCTDEGEKGCVRSKNMQLSCQNLRQLNLVTMATYGGTQPHQRRVGSEL